MLLLLLVALEVLSVVFLFLSLRNNGELVPDENLDADGTLKYEEAALGEDDNPAPEEYPEDDSAFFNL